LAEQNQAKELVANAKEMKVFFNMVEKEEKLKEANLPSEHPTAPRRTKR
jgi:hypothetical protein